MKPFHLFLGLNLNIFIKVRGVISANFLCVRSVFFYLPRPWSTHRSRFIFCHDWKKTHYFEEKDHSRQHFKISAVSCIATQWNEDGLGNFYFEYSYFLSVIGSDFKFAQTTQTTKKIKIQISVLIKWKENLNQTSDTHTSTCTHTWAIWMYGQTINKTEKLGSQRTQREWDVITVLTET